MAKKAKKRPSAGRAASRRKPSVPVRSARKKASKTARTQRTSTQAGARGQAGDEKAGESVGKAHPAEAGRVQTGRRAGRQSPPDR